MIIPKKLTLFLISFLTLFLLYSASVFSQGMEKEKPFKPGINLSAEQKDKIRTLSLDAKKDEIRLKSDLSIARLELRELMQQDELDKAKVNRKIDEIGALRTKLQKAKFEKRMALREVLTKEQLQSLRERRMHRMYNKGLMERKKRFQEGRSPRRGMHRMGPLSGDVPQPLAPEELTELPLQPEELQSEPELGFFEEELFPIFDDYEPLPPLDGLPLLPDELQPPE
jgi:Spy/CpxP family protein refolding chaperone